MNIFTAESTIEARIIGLQDLKVAVVNEIINDSNSGSSFVSGASLSVSNATSDSNQGMAIGDVHMDIEKGKSKDEGKVSIPGSGGFGAMLWNSVRTSVSERTVQYPVDQSNSNSNVAEVRNLLLLML